MGNQRSSEIDMLVITLKPDEDLRIGPAIISITERNGKPPRSRTRIVVKAPKLLKVQRIPRMRIVKND